MKILLVLDNLSVTCGANVGIMCELAKEWHGLGHEIYGIIRADAGAPMSDERATIFNKIWLVDTREKEVLAKHMGTEEWRHTGALEKIISFVKMPRLFFYALDQKCFNSSAVCAAYKRAINEICNDLKFDAVITAVEPFFLAIALTKADIPTDKYIVMSDPYSNSYNRSSIMRPWRIHQEKKAIRKVSDVFALDFVWRDMDYLTRGHLNKVHPFCIPKISSEEERGLSHIVLSDRTADESVSKLKPIEFIYTGQFYENIRNPRFLLELFLRLPDNYRLHIYGQGSAEHVVDKYEEKLGTRLVRHGWVSANEAQKAIAEADILVNLNNTVRNALPSKLVEYINSGKPILNICLTDNCPSLEYMERYPNGITVEADDDIDMVVDRIENFVNESIGKVIDHDEIKRIYNDCLNETVARDILNVIQSKL